MPLQSRAARLGMRPKRRRNGKRGRRALIRLRHQLAATRFVRWAQNGQLHLRHPLTPWRDPLWHAWHALGCP